jgi:integrase
MSRNQNDFRFQEIWNLKISDIDGKRKTIRVE